MIVFGILVRVPDSGLPAWQQAILTVVGVAIAFAILYGCPLSELRRRFMFVGKAEQQLRQVGNRGAELCYDATAAAVSLTRFEVRVYRSTTSLDAAPAIVASDTSTHDDQGCRFYAFSSAELTSADFVIPVVTARWNASGPFRLGRLTLVLEPA